MRQVLLGASVVYLSAQTAWSDEASRPPTTPSPMIVVAQAVVKDNAVQVRLLMSDVRAERRTRVVKINGKMVEQTYTVSVHLMHTVEVVLGGEQGPRVVGLKGKPVDTKELLERLKKPTPILVCFGEKVDPAYLKVVKDGTLVLTLRDRLPRLTPLRR